MAERSKTGGAGGGRSATADPSSPPDTRRGTTATVAAGNEARPTWQAGGTGATTGGTDINTESPSGAGTQQTGFISRVQQRAGERLKEQQNRTTDGMTTIAQAVRDTSARLRNERHETMAEYVDRAAAQLERFSGYLKNKDGAELWREAQAYARRRPGIFIGSAFVVGLVVARFAKSSSPQGSGRPGWQRLPTSDEHMPASRQGMA
jgi:hypothetical protein